MSFRDNFAWQTWTFRELSLAFFTFPNKEYDSIYRDVLFLSIATRYEVKRENNSR